MVFPSFIASINYITSNIPT